LALAISAISVFAFIGCVFGTFWYIKYKPNPIKNFVTSATASKSIKLTKEEIELSQINPVMKLYDKEHNIMMAEAIKNITQAIEKDNAHYFDEALILYNKGIDIFMAYMKISPNANERFKLAKKIDMYIKRAKYLQDRVNNKDLLNIAIEIAPVAPLVEKKCGCKEKKLK